MLAHAHVTPVIPVADMQRARNYYKNVLGLEEAGEHGSEYSFGKGDGERLDLHMAPKAVASSATIVTFEVSDLDKEIKELQGKGAKFEEVDLPDAKREGVITKFGDKERAAWLKDSEGNWLCLHQA
jgi:predicted enzyme related to lactoylglutathione lyase